MAQVQKSEMLRRFASELESGNAALFIGAGFSKSSGYADWTQLMKDIAEELGLEIERESDLVALAQYHVNERGGRGRINALLIEEFTKDVKLSENHQLVASLPVRTVWTTNYDELLETAFRENHKRPDVKTTQQNLAQTLPNRDVVIYKMHGDIRQPQEAVLTKEDYELYEERRSLFSTALKGDLVEKTFLFIGFSFTDPNIDYVLSRIRALIGQNQREHYCIIRWPDAPGEEDAAGRADFEYRKRKLELRISDLSRYQIHSVMIDSYYEITEILTELNRRAHTKDVFVSGSAAAFEPFGRDRLTNFAARLGREIIQRGYNLVSGFGRGIGGEIAMGALEYIYSEDVPMNRVSMFPFPQRTPAGLSRQAFQTRYRESMISNAGFAIFISGNREDTQTGKIIPAPGVLEEFEIAAKLERMPIPLGASGWAAKSIWDEVSGKQEQYFGRRNVASSLRTLGDPQRSDDEYINAIFEMLGKLGA
jgi:hypothetical protein